jgi:hypothetical protein
LIAAAAGVVSLRADKAFLLPTMLVPAAMLCVTVFFPLVYSQGQVSIATWQLASAFLIPVLFVKAKAAHDSGILFWLSSMLLIGFATIQPLFIDHSNLVIKVWLLYLSQLYVFTVLALAYTKEEMFRIFSGFVVVAAPVIAGIMILQFVTGSTIGNPRSYFGAENPASTWMLLGKEFVRPLGTLDNPNVASAFLLVSMPFQFYSYSANRSRLLYTSIVLSFIAITLTLSRGVILGIGIFAGSYFLLRYYRLVKAALLTRAGAASMVVLVPGLAVILLEGGVWELVLSRFEMMLSDPMDGGYISRGSVEFRLLMSWIGFKAGLEHPFVGVGLGGSAFILSDYSSLMPPWWQHRIHAFVPAIFAEAGVVSGAIWLTLQLTALFRSFQAVKRDGSAYARAIFSANAVTFYLSFFYTTLFSQDFGPIYFIVLLLGIKSGSVRHAQSSILPNTRAK